MFGCVSGPDWGAMGLHYVDLALVGDDRVDPTRPEIVIYEPLPNGRLPLISADFLVFASAWHANNQPTPDLAFFRHRRLRGDSPRRPVADPSSTGFRATRLRRRARAHRPTRGPSPSGDGPRRSS
jgi:hypothetical protein